MFVAHPVVCSSRFQPQQYEDPKRELFPEVVHLKQMIANFRMGREVSTVPSYSTLFCSTLLRNALVCLDAFVLPCGLDCLGVFLDETYSDKNEITSGNSCRYCKMWCSILKSQLVSVLLIF